MNCQDIKVKNVEQTKKPIGLSMKSHHLASTLVRLFLINCLDKGQNNYFCSFVFRPFIKIEERGKPGKFWKVSWEQKPGPDSGLSSTDLIEAQNSALKVRPSLSPGRATCIKAFYKFWASNKSIKAKVELTKTSQKLITYSFLVFTLLSSCQ